MQFKGIIFIGVTKIFPEFVLKGLATKALGAFMYLKIAGVEV